MIRREIEHGIKTKIYRPTNKLKDILVENGFLSEMDSVFKDKVIFKRSHNSKRSIRFDRGTIRFIYGCFQTDSVYVLTEYQLKLVLFYHKLSALDRKCLGEGFNFKLVERRLSNIEQDLRITTKYSIMPHMQKKYKRILNFYNSVLTS